MLLTGMRPGEIAALRVRHYVRDAAPLGKLLVALALASAEWIYHRFSALDPDPMSAT